MRRGEVSNKGVQGRWLPQLDVIPKLVFLLCGLCVLHVYQTKQQFIPLLSGLYNADFVYLYEMNLYNCLVNIHSLNRIKINF